MSTNPYAAPVAEVTPGYDQQQAVIPGLQNLQYPLQLRFKVIAFAPQLQVTDATGKPVIYIKQKLFKFKEKVEIFTDKSKTTKLAAIQANKVIDWSARYFFETANGEPIGSLGRKGMKSLWKATYETFNHGDETPDYKITEENPAAKVFDSLLGEVPVLGFATAFLFNPRYGAVSHKTNETAMRLTKKPAMFEGKFELEKLSNLSQHEETNLILSFMMLVLLERARG